MNKNFFEVKIFWIYKIFRVKHYYRGAGYKTLLIAVYKTSLLFGGSEVAGYKTPLLFRASQVTVYKTLTFLKTTVVDAVERRKSLLFHPFSSVLEAVRFYFHE